LALIWLLVAYVAAPPASDKSPGCNECYVYLGRWWEPGFAVFIIGLNLVAWWIGGLIGSAVRAAAGSRT
jgi:hypothetical protein